MSNNHSEKKHTHSHEGQQHAHVHEHDGIFGNKTELIFSLTGGAFLLIGFVLSFITAVPSWISITCYVISYFFGGYFATKEAAEGIAQRQFDIDFLMLVAAIGAAILGDWAEGALLLFLFSLGHSLEHYAMNKARKSIAALSSLAPSTAIVQKDGKETEVPLSEIVTGDTIVIKPNSKIAADGVVIKGSSAVNQAPITGESIPVDKLPVPDPNADLSNEKNIPAQHKVFAGTINGNNVLLVKVLKKTSDSTLSRLIQLVSETVSQKSPTQLFTDKVQKYYVPSVLLLVITLLFAFLVIDEPFSKSFYRSMSVLVAASPCALAIATPSAVLSGVARAARAGILIKGGAPLENLGGLTAMAFDKTGTITEGKPRLTGITTFSGVAENDLLAVVIAVESLSDHPIAAAIVKDAKERLQQEVSSAQNLQAIAGRGVKAVLNSDIIYIGNKELLHEQGGLMLGDDVLKQVEESEKAGNTTMLVQRNKEVIGMISVMDIPRPEAAEAISQLRQSGIRKIVMLSGDNQQVAEAVSKQVGITETWGNLMPEQKLDAIKRLTETEKKIAMVGDGVNDAPAMAKSTVGVAMGAAGSDVALETADIALMSDKLSVLPFAIRLSRYSARIIQQNLWISLGMVAILIPLTITGIASMGPAVMAHEGSTVVVAMNALRLLVFKGKMRNA
ncbi:MAG: heavy metal translocating P-type ATPase [Chitinophagaceae bacterium]